MDKSILATAETIKNCLLRTSGPFSISDVSAKSGLSLRDSQIGLQYLTSEYRGHLAATSTGELIFTFPNGFTKPWEKTEALERAWAKVKKTLLAAAKLIVRAWISVVMIGYVVIFALILLGLFAAKKSDKEDDRRDSDGGFMFGLLFRLVADSLFWTFHPFSPYYDTHHSHAYPSRRKSDVPFYERVNRYFFGPEDPPKDPNAVQKKMLALIRAKRGRIGASDVMKVTGLSPHAADPLLAKLMLDYDGDVSVSDEGSLVYTFKEIRKTVENSFVPEPAPIWLTKEKIKPLTGNSASTNTLITLLNGFNLFMSTIALSQGWTIERLQLLFDTGRRFNFANGAKTLAEPGIPLVLGLIPFCFSLILFSIPMLRWFNKSKEKQKIERENGRRGLLFAVLNNLTPRGLPEHKVKSAWEKLADAKAEDKTIVREVVKLGGDVEVSEDGQVYYRFKQIENEIAALTKERVTAPDSEKDMGSVIFSSAT